MPAYACRYMASSCRLLPRLVSASPGEHRICTRAPVAPIYIYPLQADLYKESRTFRGRTWGTRYFLLSGQMLFYYKSQASYGKGDPPHKAFDVADCWVMDTGLVKSGSKVSLRAGECSKEYVRARERTTANLLRARRGSSCWPRFARTVTVSFFIFVLGDYCVGPWARASILVF